MPLLLSRQYRSLRALAERILAQHRLMQKAAGPDRVSPTSLVAEATLRLLMQRQGVKNDDHLHGLAAITMRRALLDGARRRRSRELAADRVKTPADGDANHTERELRQILETLRRAHPRQAEAIQLVALRDMSPSDAARRLGISEATLRRDLRAARTWLARRVRGE